jgi:hypothetical protein
LIQALKFEAKGAARFLEPWVESESAAITSNCSASVAQAVIGVAKGSVQGGVIWNCFQGALEYGDGACVVAQC